ncbi:MAG: HAMP domain-containing histidine kinase [Candidatus Latescibacteria bacterium]|nr:HAMP domain-containing histidine kinase [Candidatus Latescibacterota bacterium]
MLQWMRQRMSKRSKPRNGAPQKRRYKAGATFKGSLFVVAILLVFIYLVHMQLVLRQLKDHEKTTSDIYAKIYAYAASELASDDDLSFIFQEVIKRTTYPVIITTIDDSLVAWQGVGVGPDDFSPDSRARLREFMKRMDKYSDPIPLRVPVERLDRLTPDVKVKIDQMGGLFGYLHYGESYALNRLRWMPLIEMGTILLFLFIGFLGFRNIKNSEQRYIWVGMAKETAHQLGTPLSSLFGWLELMKAEIEPIRTLECRGGFRKFDHILAAMEQDVHRMTRMASRFNLIGSVPELKTQNVVPIVAEVIFYMKERLPQLGRDVRIFEEYEEVPEVPVNRELLGWAFENLMKNALDAMDRTNRDAEIRVRVRAETRKIRIEFKDNGRGISSKDRKKIFRPGYTTKNYGWGLGLTFVKRIVEEYHGGKVFLRESIVDEGTAMVVDLPVPTK